MKKHLLASLVFVLVVALAPAAGAQAEATAVGSQAEATAACKTCDEACPGCVDCKIFTDCGSQCTGCPRQTVTVQFTGERTARISVPVDQSLLADWGIEGTLERLTLSSVPGIFSVESSHLVASTIDGTAGQTAIFEVTLAPGATQEMVLSGLRSSAFFTVEANDVGEFLIPAEDLLSDN